MAVKRAELTRLFVALTTESARSALGVQPGPEIAAAAYFQVGGLGRLLTWIEGDVELEREQLMAVCVQMLLP